MRNKIGLVGLSIALLFVAKGLFFTSNGANGAIGAPVPNGAPVSNAAIGAAVSNQVTLQRPTGEPLQMWAEPGSGQDAFADFPVGTVCTNLDDSITIKWEEGMYSTFDKLDCQGQVGYINAKFVES